MRKLVIDRTIWYRGQSSIGSRLLIPQDGDDPGKRCCLGIYGKEIGVPDDLLEDQTCFGNFGRYEDIPEEAHWLVTTVAEFGLTNSGDAQELMMINDEETMDEDDRELAITKYFKRHDVEVTFIN